MTGALFEKFCEQAGLKCVRQELKTPIVGTFCRPVPTNGGDGIGRFGPTGINVALGGAVASHEIFSSGTVNTAKSAKEKDATHGANLKRSAE
jgi:hypothetical protein